ncbi:MAG: 3-keto-5-aminohexanoate cleavage protein, partial [Solirubrobacteraceae bacterium]
MSLEDPVVLTCAISGVIAGRDQCPAIPYTPQEYAAEARRIVDEGGVHIHIHARTPDGTPSYEVDDFVAIRDAIRAELRTDVIINFSTGTVGVPVAKRIAYLEAGLPEVAALNMGSLNYAKYSRKRKEFVFKFVFTNSFEEIIELLEAMRALGIKPEHECFDLGHVGALHPLLDMGRLERPLHANFVMGVVGGVPATARNLAAMADNMPAGDNHWSVVG